MLKYLSNFLGLPIESHYKLEPFTDLICGCRVEVEKTWRGIS